MKPILLVIDNGHGYDTPGKRGTLPNGEIFEEWEFNRIMKMRLISKLSRRSPKYGQRKILFHDLVPESNDISLAERMNRTNALYQKHKMAYDVVFVSLHADAAEKQGPTGLSVWTTPGITKSDAIAEAVAKGFEQAGIQTRKFSKSQANFESNFYVLRNSLCPAILIEFGFMTTYSDVEKLHDSNYQEKLIDSLITSLETFK